MPRYFFHIVDGSFLIDGEGTVLTGVAEAHSQAITMAGEILRDRRGNFSAGEDWQMHVIDDNKHTLFKLKFSMEETRDAAEQL